MEMTNEIDKTFLMYIKIFVSYNWNVIYFDVRLTLWGAKRGVGWMDICEERKQTNIELQWSSSFLPERDE